MGGSEEPLTADIDMGRDVPVGRDGAHQQQRCSDLRAELAFKASKETAHDTSFRCGLDGGHTHHLLPRLNTVHYTEWHSFVESARTPASVMNMVQSGSQAPPRVLDQARRRRVIKPADERRREILEAAT